MATMRSRKFSRSGQSLYELLEIQKDATDTEIKRAYRRLALMFHPDKNANNQDATEKFKAINRAHGILYDSTKRQIYDRYGSLGIYAAERVGEENVKAYLLLNSAWCKALTIFSVLVTGCCCCCCCCLCCNFCCGKCKPQAPDDDVDYCQMADPCQDDTVSPEDTPIVSQPGSEHVENQTAEDTDETTSLTQDAKTQYGGADSTLVEN